MLKQCPSKIFKSDQRGLDETPFCSRLSTLNYGSFNHPGKGSFGQLQFINDESISAGGTINLQYNEDLIIVLLPVQGVLSICGKHWKEEQLMPETVKVFKAASGGFYRVCNPSAQAANYLHLGFRARSGHVERHLLPNEISLIKRNELATLGFENSIGEDYYGGVGVFEGRAEGVYRPRGSSGVFAYVINGAFEVEGRLLEHRDGLGLWDTDEVEFEALAENSVLLLLGLPMKRI